MTIQITEAQAAKLAWEHARDQEQAALFRYLSAKRLNAGSCSREWFAHKKAMERTAMMGGRYFKLIRK